MLRRVVILKTEQGDLQVKGKRVLVRCDFNVPFDDDGIIGSKGMISEELLSELMDDDYFKMLPPKSTGR